MSAEKLEFKTDLKQLLDIITHSLYSHKEVFLRELISNSCDAIDKIRFNSLGNESILEGNSDWKIKIIPDEKAGTLTISDNGIGMSRDSIISDLGTIARSGTQAFVQNLEKLKAADRPDLIGQFGVGFYASFMVADKVTVISRTAGDADAGVKWESDGKGDYEVETVTKKYRGTDVILHMRDDEKEFLKPWMIRQTVTKFSDFLEHPVVMDVEKEKEKKEGEETQTEIVEETLNRQKAIWLRSKSEITDEEYTEFYKHITRDFSAPAKTIHYTVEGATEFRALLFIPEHKPFDLSWGEPKSHLQLYIRRVFITDDCEALLPGYLRFVHGVVDCTDLPLNVSREMLQNNPKLTTIQRNMVKKILATLEEMKQKDFDEYIKFFKELGTILKEGVSQDFVNKEKIADLLLFESTATESGKYTSLDKYVESMPDDQEEIYYLIGENRNLLDGSPHLEGFRAAGKEVLLMTEPFDEFMVAALPEYKGKKLKAADKGELPASEEEKKEQDETKEEFADLFSLLNDKIDEVKEVRLSKRLTESASCLVADENAMGAHMERLMEKLGRNDSIPQTKRILELNAKHPAVKAVQALYTKDPQDERIAGYGRLLYEQAVLAEGSKIKDPASFSEIINNLLVKDAAK